VFSVIMPVTMSCNSHYWTCLGHLGQWDTNRNDPICVALPRWLRQVQPCTAFAGIIASKCHQCKRALYDQELKFINAGKVLGKNCQENFDFLRQGHFSFACLGHLGQWDTNRNDPICVAPPKVAKASTVTCCCRWSYHQQMLPM
jgi:hypothetical protein